MLTDPAGPGEVTNWSFRRALLILVVVGVAYAVGSDMSYAWFDANGADASFFPAAGVTMAALLVLQPPWWPSVLVGAGVAEVLVNRSHGMSWQEGGAYAMPNLVQPLVGAYLLGAIRGRIDLGRISHLAGFLLGGVVVAPLVGGILGAMVFRTTGPSGSFPEFAVEWWVGDGLGVLVVGGSILALRPATARAGTVSSAWARWSAGAAAVGATFVAFRLDWFVVVYVAVALLFVIAVRAGTRDVAVTGALMAFVAAEGTARGHRFWDALGIDDATGLLHLQLALALVVSSALLMAAALSERETSTLARSQAEQASRDALAARHRAELLGRLAEQLGRATDPAGIAAVLSRFGLRGADPLTTTPPMGSRVDPLVLDSARRMAADALARAQLIEHERVARQRAESLEHHAARLAAATSVDEVATATVTGLSSLGPTWAAVWRLDGDLFTLLAHAGTSGIDVSPYQVVPLHADLPLADAARRGDMVTCDSRDELFARYPGTRSLGGAATRVESVAVVPLHAQSLHVIGALVVTSEEPNWTTDDRRQLLISIADQCGLALDRSELQRRAGRAAADAELLARLSDALDRATTAADRAGHVVREVIARGARAASVELVDDEDHVTLGAGGQRRLLDSPDLVIPLQARGRVLGRLSMHTGDVDADQRTLFQAIASRAAIAIDNALLYERERDVSHRLQLGLLDVSFPEIDGVRIEGAYRPGTATLDIGGDWHDAFVLPTGAIALVVGDVVGHDVEAAIAMAQLRGAVRALAAVSSPSELLDRLDSFVDSLPHADMTTLVYVELDPLSGRLRYACAGHPPPAVVSATGVSRLLWGGRSTPLGGQFGSRRIESIDVLGDAERLVLYTDGLIERRGERLDIGFARLLDTTAHDVASIDFVDRLCDHMLDGEPQRDDVCVLTATRLDGQSYARSLSSTPSELGALRRELRTWLSAWVHDERTQQDVLLAVSEAVSNAVEHGASSGTDRPIVVVATTAGDEVRITVRDHGVWREPVPSIERGRGIGIMRALMDDVAVERHDDGTVVRLGRTLSPS
ncbi:MAG: SpoIIE family protein phosphatase [Acidimicrobiales bacterium]|nr:SpoIIE family protein phosphatase [Acidimicrobiales bacterium]MCB9393542.1 SpoIIE family protein phosphatase [Acidimicrobiaceae bacterium]